MQYVGIQTQKKRNNFRSGFLLFLFPCLVLGLVLLFSYLLLFFGSNSEYATTPDVAESAWSLFLQLAPGTLIAVGVWFLIAYFANTSIIQRATHSKTLERSQNKRVYNLVENLCMSQGMAMPKLNVIEDSSLNAFASGINKSSYTVTLTTGIIARLDDDELEGVIAHELSHIRNHDVRLLIVSIVFVGIFAMVAQVSLMVVARGGGRSSGNKNNGGAIVILLLVVLLAFVGYLFSTMMRFAISRNREYMADAGGAEMTKNPMALARALRKISGDPNVESVERDDIAQLFIEHPHSKAKGDNNKNFFSNLFATHPPIEKRIEVLEQF